jgi:hypothetical protein
MALQNSFASFFGAVYPAESNVLITAPVYGDSINVLNGAYTPSGGGGCSYPGTDDVREGIIYADGALLGVLELPLPSQVLVGTGYGANGTEYDGTLNFPPGGISQPLPPVMITGQIASPLINGDSYTDALGRAFVWFVDPMAGMTTATPVSFKGYLDCACTGTPAWTAPGAVVLDGTQWKLTFELDSATTAALDAGEYGWAVTFDQGGEDVTIETGTVDFKCG